MEKLELNRAGCPALRVVMFPKDTNPSGNIFGGVILSHVDVAAGIAARSATKHRVVTRSFKEAEFKKPVKIGDILTCWAWVTKVGTTSITTHVVAEVERNGEYIKVTEAEVVYVSVDEQDRPIPVDSPPGTQGRDKPVAPASDATGKTVGGDATGAGAKNCTCGENCPCGESCACPEDCTCGSKSSSCSHSDKGEGKGKSKKRSKKEKKRAGKDAKRLKKEAKLLKKEAKRAGKVKDAGAEKGSGCQVCSPPSGGKG